MKKEKKATEQQHPFMKMAGMKDMKKFMDKYPSDEHFFADYPQARYGYMMKADEGIKVPGIAPNVFPVGPHSTSEDRPIDSPSGASQVNLPGSPDNTRWQSVQPKLNVEENVRGLNEAGQMPQQGGYQAAQGPAFKGQMSEEGQQVPEPSKGKHKYKVSGGEKTWDPFAKDNAWNTGNGIKTTDIVSGAVSIAAGALPYQPARQNIDPLQMGVTTGGYGYGSHAAAKDGAKIAKSGKKLSATKAREMLHNPPHGQDLSEKQRKYFGAVASGYAADGGPIFYWADSTGVSTRAKYLSDIANVTSEYTDASTFSSGVSTITVSATLAANLYPYMPITGTGIPAGTYVAANYITNSTSVPINTTTTSASSGNYTYYYAGAFVPKQTYQVITSAIQEFIIAYGANSYVPGNPNTSFNPMLVRWSDQANAYQWIPQLTNQSGEFTLTNGSYIMAARTTRQEILVWTDSCLYSQQYLGTPYVWGFQVLMDNISVISPNSMITVNNVTYWMGRDRFYMYSGRVEVLPCSLRQYIFDDINQDQSYQVFAGANEAFNEVWWYYVSQSSDNTTVDRYVIYNYLDRVWYYGTMARSAWMQTGTQPYPIAADYNGRLLYHENGCDDVSTSATLPIDAYVQSSDFDIGDGHNFGFVWRILPDVNFNGSTVNQPTVTMTVKPRENSGTPYGSADNPQVQSAQNYTNAPAYTIQQFDGQVYTRLRGRQMAFRIESTGVGVAWQLGSPRIDIRPDGRR